MPLGAAYSLLRFHDAGVPAAVSDCEYDEYNDMSGLFGNRDSEIKDRGFIIYSNDEYFEAYLNYLKNTRGYPFIRFVNVSAALIMSGLFFCSGFRQNGQKQTALKQR